MFIVSVEFDIHPEFTEAFREAVLVQAKNSVTNEAACKQFDVSQDIQQPNRFFLYETYDNAEAFEAHRQTKYFAEYAAKVAEMVEEKFLQTWSKIS